MARALVKKIGNNVVQTLYEEIVGTQAITGLIVADNTIPQITEGSEIFNVDYTPKKVGNTLVLKASIYLREDANTGNLCGAALFLNNAADAIAVGSNGNAPSTALDGGLMIISKKVIAQSGTMNFKIRGGSSNGNSTLNVDASAPANVDFGQKMVSSFEITEIEE